MKDREKKYRVNDQGMIVEEIDELDRDEIYETEYPPYSDEHMFNKTALAAAWSLELQYQ